MVATVGARVGARAVARARAVAVKVKVRAAAARAAAAALGKLRLCQRRHMAMARSRRCLFRCRHLAPGWEIGNVR